MYSADMSSSSKVDIIPRFSNTGLPISPTAWSRLKFCMLRVPICRMSAYSATKVTCSGAITSVTMASPVSALASARSSSPLSPNPWKL
jgi:hypothetical protein